MQKPRSDNIHSAQAYRGAIGGTVRRMNLLAVLRALRHGDVVSSSELRCLMDVNASTIARLMGVLTSSGLVVEEGHEAIQGVGRRAKLWRLHANAGYVVGVHAMGRRMRAVVVDLTGAPVGCAETRDPDPPSTATLGPRLHRVASSALEGLPPSEVLGIGVGTGGVIDPATGVLRASGALRGTDGESAVGFALGPELERELPWAARVGNDAKLAALAVFRERVRAGEVAADGSLVYLMSGEDPGQSFSLGVVIGGRLYAGRSGAAGEVLRLPSGIQVAEGAADLFARASAGDDSAAVAAAEAVRPLLGHLVGTALSLDPDWIVLGGGYAGLGAHIERAAHAIVESSFTRAKYLAGLPRPNLATDELWPHTVELGAAGLVLDELFSPPESDAEPLLIRRALSAAG